LDGLMESMAEVGSVFRFGLFEANSTSSTLTRSGLRVKIQDQPFQLLMLLLRRPGEVVTREELLNEVWGYESYPVSRTVDNHIAALRAKLETDPARPIYIRTVHGVGYQFVHRAIS